MFEIFSLALNRHRSLEHYRAMQEYIAGRAIEELEARGVDFSCSDVLELASGAGGYSKPYAERAKSFLASDLNPHTVFSEQGIPFAKFNVNEPFPLDTDSFDLICCSSLIEHIARPRDMLLECKRALRPNGILYLTFPPFFSVAMVGGHSFKPFHFLGERVALAIHNWRRGTRIESYGTAWGNYGMYPLTISRVAALVGDCGFTIVDTYTRMSPVNTAKLPWILKDLATWHVCYLARA